MKSLQKIGVVLTIIGLVIFTVLPFIGNYRLDEVTTIAVTKDIHSEAMVEILSPMFGKVYSSNTSFISSFKEYFNTYNEALKDNQEWDKVIWDNYAFPITKAAFLYCSILVS